MLNALQFGERRMFREMDVLTMGGNRDFRFGPAVELRDLATARMAGRMNQRIAIGNDLDAGSG